LVVRIQANDVAHGTAQGLQTTRVGGVEFTASVAARVTEPLPSTGRANAPIELRYRVSDDRGTVRDASLVLPAEFLVDGRAAALRGAEIPQKFERLWNEPPITQRFPGTDDYGEFAVRFHGIGGVIAR
jgi:hypothetical protein